MARLSPPPSARVPLVSVNGVNIYLNPEWARYFENLTKQVTETADSMSRAEVSGAAGFVLAEQGSDVEFIPGPRGAPGQQGPAGPALWLLQNEPEAPDLIGFAPPVTEPLIAVSFLNSWVDFGAGWAAATYFKDPAGIVRLRGLVKSGVVGNAIFNLPAGYRPSTSESFAVQSNSLFGRCDVNGSGDVVATVGSNVNFSLSGISFRAGV